MRKKSQIHVLSLTDSWGKKKKLTLFEDSTHCEGQERVLSNKKKTLRTLSAVKGKS